MLEYFKIYKDFGTRTEYLSDAEIGRLIKGIVQLLNDEEPTAVTGNERYVFSNFKAQLELDMKQHKIRAAASSENGKKGGRPRKDAQKEVPTIETPDDFVADRNWTRVCSEYERNIGALPIGFLLDRLSNYYTDFGADAVAADIISEGIRMTNAANATSPKYLFAILEGWVQAEVQSLDDAKRESARHGKKYSKGNDDENLPPMHKWVR